MKSLVRFYMVHETLEVDDRQVSLENIFRELESRENVFLIVSTGEFDPF